jgi:MYXO-CTERM domain-containing protein
VVVALSLPLFVVVLGGGDGGDGSDRGVAVVVLVVLGSGRRRG